MNAPDHGTGGYGKAADGQWYPIGISTPVAASGTLTLAANATEGETFTIGTTGQQGRTVYTWTATLGTTAANRVLIGSTASDSIDNAILAVNRTTGEGVYYSNPTTVNTLVSAAAGAGDTMVVTALVTGGEGNNIGTTEGMANGSWGSTTLTGGAYGGLNGGSTTGLTDTQLRASAVPVSMAAVPVGAATAAKQPALGTQAAPSTDVITVISPRPSVFTNIGANATLNVKATTGNVFSVSCNNANAATRYLQLHNTATVPGAAAVPVYSFPVYASGTTIIGTDFFTNAGVNFSTGIAFAFSTTLATYTAGTAGEQYTTVHYL